MADIRAVIPGERQSGPPRSRTHRGGRRDINSAVDPGSHAARLTGCNWRFAVPKAFVFDAYGTLFDVHAAIARHRGAAGPEADRFSEIWRSKQLEYAWMLSAASHYVDFWTLTEHALDHAFARVPSVDRTLRAALLDAYFKLDAFPDARAGLGALRARGMLTAILSNGTPRMLQGAVDAAGIGSDLDAVLSVDAIGIYKPRREVYALAAAAFRLAPG